ncbi:MAG TPA: MerR family transcriptional regulator [Anaerolineaceae bacterium]|nr:MerR family transcriptional regulator [Anaerolineaceae bacterium]
MKQKRYLIGDLAEKAGVTVRTIRYYTEKGLLPEPDRSSKYAYYTSEHLERLDLIRKLKDLRLPLWEIEDVINSGDSDTLQKLLDQANESPRLNVITDRFEIPESKPGDSALEYISSLVDAKQIIKENRISSAPRSPARSQSPSQPAPTSKWTRVEISPDIEIHFRQPLKPDQQKRLDQLLVEASHIFSR